MPTAENASNCAGADSTENSLVRGIGLLQATSANMLQMIGIGPFITIPIIIQAMGGPHAMIGWIAGALVAACDGLVWAELGAAMPGSGGPYVYLTRAFGPRRFGRLMSFLYIWQTVFSAPLGIASGAVGFALYVHYFLPGMTPIHDRLVAATVCLAVTALLYRDIRSVGWLSVAMWAVVMATVVWIVVSGLASFELTLISDMPPGKSIRSGEFFSGLGAATLIAMYSFGGYANVCLFGGEVRNPSRNIPWSIMLAILVVAIFYLVMSLTIIGVVPWREAMQSTAVVSDFIARIYGGWAGTIVTLLILWTSLGSVFACMLGYSRVPYAAAADGRFFRIFSRVHPRRRFPHVSLLFIGLTSAAACWFALDEIIKALMVIQVLIQFLSQIVAVTVIRRYRPEIERPFSIWLYPLPSLIAAGGWIYILLSSGAWFIVAGLALVIVGVGSYLLRARLVGDWPFASSDSVTDDADSAQR